MDGVEMLTLLAVSNEGERWDRKARRWVGSDPGWVAEKKYEERYDSYDLGDRKRLAKVPRRFYSVMRVESVSFGNARSVLWRAMTPVGDGKADLFWMPTHALEDVLVKCEFVGPGLIDGLWELKGVAGVLGLWPVVDGGGGG